MIQQRQDHALVCAGRHTSGFYAMLLDEYFHGVCSGAAGLTRNPTRPTRVKRAAPIAMALLMFPVRQNFGHAAIGDRLAITASMTAPASSPCKTQLS